MKLENIIVIGMSHKELSLEERELFLKLQPLKKIEELYKRQIIEGYINLSTCLRMEIYIQLKNSESLKKLLETFQELHITMREGEAAINYLFRVACGFESVIKGEDQILAQLKRAHEIGMEEKTTTPLLNVIFNKGAELGKKFRYLSKISHNNLSLEGISLKFIKSQIKNVDEKKVLILGMGDLSESLMKLLLKEGVKDITITNRSHHKSLEIQRNYPVKVIGFDRKIPEAVENDIIISATSAPHFVIYKEEFAAKMRADKDYLFLDLAVPRDIEESLNLFPNIKVFNLDHVWEVYHNNIENRENLLLEYEYLIFEQIENLKKWISYRKNMKK